HGHLGWLAAAALVHPAILLRHPRRRAHLAVAGALALVTGAACIGLGIYGAYRERLRREILLEAPSLGWLFERKEHLAFGAFTLAWAAAIAYFAAEASRDDVRVPLRRAAHHGFVIAALLALCVAAFGTVIAAFRSF